MIQLKNDFHSTVCGVRAKLGQPLSKSQIRRTRRELCGIADCSCGGVLGERGPQGVHVEYDWGNEEISLVELRPGETF